GEAAGELVPDLLLRVVEDPLPRLAGGHPRDALELSSVDVPELLHLVLQLAEMHLAVGDPLLPAHQLRELAVDVILLRENALLDLHDLVAALTELGLDIAAELDRLLARLDRRLASRCLRVTAGLVEHQVAFPPRGLEPRA